MSKSISTPVSTSKPTSKYTSKPVPKLNEKQQLLYDKVVNENKNVFFTGCGGTGKSFIVNHIVTQLRSKTGYANAVAVTASTGRAAFNIGGVTLHSFAGIGLGTQTTEELVKRISYNSRAADRWRSTKILLIDEISMIDGNLFDKVEAVARGIRRSTKPFGGIQLVLVGDLLQLPPVSTSNKVPRVFQSKQWDNCIKDYVRLDVVFRQSDPSFIKALCCIRVGAITEQVIECTNSITRELTYEDELKPVLLYATKNKADKFNETMLNEIQGEIKEYIAEDKFAETASTRMLDTCPAPGILQIKKGAHVMLIKNLNKDLVNGTTGIVTGFTTGIKSSNIVGINTLEKQPIPIVRFTLANNRVYTKPVGVETWETILPNGTIQCSRTQIPLILSWAITIHKSQGQTIQRLKIDFQGIFESGQVYTALSRAVSKETLEILNFNHSTIKVDEDSLKFCLEHDLI